MDTVSAFRTRYARTSDEDLLALVAIEPWNLTPEARQALGEEVVRRGLHGPGTAALVGSISYNPRSDMTREMRYPKAPFWSRVVAYGIDSVIGSVAVAAAAFAVFTHAVTRNGPLLGLIVVGAIGWAIYYMFTKDGREGGQSVGKEMLDLMVVNIKTNEPCKPSESAVRTVILFLLQLVPLAGFLVEPIVAIAAEDGRRLGDRVVDTQVIRASDYRPNSPV